MKSVWNAIQSEIGRTINIFSTQDYIDWGFKLIKILLIIAGAKIAIKIGNYIISNIFKNRKNIRLKVDEKKGETLKTLSQSILRYTIYFIATVTVLKELGIDTTSIITAAGIGGLAIGFGAQNLVKDVISGFFILFEDQYAVGDFVKIDDITGTVEEIGLRTSKIRAYTGELHIIPNGEITRVTNYTRGNMVAIVDMSIAYEMDIDRAIEVMKKTANEYAKENPNIVEEPQVLGVTNLGSSEVVIRLIARTVPMKHWEVERELRKRIKQAFDSSGIEIPYPRMVVINRKEK